MDGVFKLLSKSFLSPQGPSRSSQVKRTKFGPRKDLPSSPEYERMVPDWQKSHVERVLPDRWLRRGCFDCVGGGGGGHCIALGVRK